VTTTFVNPRDVHAPVGPYSHTALVPAGTELVFIAGQVSRLGDDGVYGKLGAGLGIPEGQKAARWCALNIIAHLKSACGGDLDRVKRAVKIGGFVNGAPDFPDSPTVMNGCSDLMVEIFGEAGKHARFAISVASSRSSTRTGTLWPC